MNFRSELAEAVMAGRKTVTRRLVSDNPNSPWWREECKMKVGRDYAVCPGRGKPAIGRVRVVSVDRVPLGYLSGAEAAAEGFACREDFEDAFRAINGAYDGRALVWRVEFQVTA